MTFAEFVRVTTGTIRKNNATNHRMLQCVTKLVKNSKYSPAEVQGILGNLKDQIVDIYETHGSTSPTYVEYFLCKRALEEAAQQLQDEDATLPPELEQAAQKDLGDLEFALQQAVGSASIHMTRITQMIRDASFILTPQENRQIDEVVRRSLPPAFLKRHLEYGQVIERFERARERVIPILTIVYQDMEKLANGPILEHRCSDPIKYTIGDLVYQVAKSTSKRPDLYIRRRAPDKNRVTTSRLWWEELTPLKRTLLESCEFNFDNEMATVTVEAVFREFDNYLIALVDDGCDENGVVIDFPPKNNKIPLVRTHIQSILNRKAMLVEKVLGLADSSDITSEKMEKADLTCTHHHRCSVYIRCTSSTVDPSNVGSVSAPLDVQVDSAAPPLPLASSSSLRPVASNPSMPGDAIPLVESSHSRDSPGLLLTLSPNPDILQEHGLLDPTTAIPPSSDLPDSVLPNDIMDVSGLENAIQIPQESLII